MQILFLWDTHGDSNLDLARQLSMDGTEDDEVRHAAIQMAQAAWEQRAANDATVERLAPQWPPKRQPGVDRSILRLAMCELGGGDTPPKVVIDEAIELAKQFSTEQSAAFINGVLDAALKEHQALTG
jgi:N utilization substance protein B